MTSKDSNSYRHILKYTGVFGSVQGLSIFIGLVRNKLVAVLLGPAGMGMASIFNSTINFVAQLSNLGLSFSAVRNISEAYESGDRQRIDHNIRIIRSWSLVTAVIGTLICAAFGSLLSDFTFSWGDHTIHFIVLAPAVGMAAITGGETAILKGTRRLGALATIQVYTVVATLIITAPLLYFFGHSGVVPMIVLTACASMLMTIIYSYRYYRPTLAMSHISLTTEVRQMLRLGIAYSVAGIMTAGIDFFIRSFLSNETSLDVVGLYNCGYAITVSYGSLLFSALGSDFYPRLSAVNTDREACNAIINKQAEVLLLIISPLLVLFSIGLPLIISLLFSREFMPVIGMVQVCIPALYLRAIRLPVAFLTLAKGDSRNYMYLEICSDIVTVVSVIAGYSLGGLTGIGFGLLVTELINIIVINIFAHYRYGYRSSRSIAVYSAQQLPIALAVYISITLLDGAAYWIAGACLFLLSASFSLYYLRRKK